jgi:ADP-ribose pyrophosphatase
MHRLSTATLPVDSADNPWTVHQKTVCYENRWMRVTEHEVTNPGGKPGIYGTVHFKNFGIGVLPIDDEGYVTLIGQYRFPVGRFSWEMPEGGGPCDGDPQEAAARELREEAGLLAEHWLEVLRMETSNGITDEQAICFVAWSLHPTEAEPEDDERLTVARLPFAEVLSLVLRGRLSDAMTVATVMKVRLLAEAGALPDDLAALVLR